MHTVTNDTTCVRMGDITAMKEVGEDQAADLNIFIKLCFNQKL